MGSSMCVKKKNLWEHPWFMYDMFQSQKSVFDSCMMCSNTKSQTDMKFYFILLSFLLACQNYDEIWLGDGDIVYLILGLSPFVDSIFNHEMSYWISYCWRIFNLIEQLRWRGEIYCVI
jgi:hypothetical protein